MREVQALLLAAGLGTRLSPLTAHCPKSLMPISGRPILEYWLSSLYQCGVRRIFVNFHHHRAMMEKFLGRRVFKGWVTGLPEDALLGTAGTVREISDVLASGVTLLAHADNWCQTDLDDFLFFHEHLRPAGAVISMMVFRSPTPKSCGVVEVDATGMVSAFFEKVSNPPGNLANGAVYLLEPEVISWIRERPEVVDFSVDVVPQFIKRIAVWENQGIHRDIGAVGSLVNAQMDPVPTIDWEDDDSWTQEYRRNLIHEELEKVIKEHERKDLKA